MRERHFYVYGACKHTDIQLRGAPLDRLDKTVVDIEHKIAKFCPSCMKKLLERLRDVSYAQSCGWEWTLPEASHNHSPPPDPMPKFWR